MPLWPYSGAFWVGSAAAVLAVMSCAKWQVEWFNMLQCFYPKYIAAVHEQHGKASHGIRTVGMWMSASVERMVVVMGTHFSPLFLYLSYAPFSAD